MKTRSTQFITEAETAWEELGGGVSRQIMAYDGQLMLVKVKFETGAIGSVHTHYHTQASYVAAGAFEVEIDGEKKILREGDSFYVAPDLPHGVVCLEAGILMDSFSPMRADFLK
ncbi:MAG: cupin domain-containing protein [Bacteroidales bacterium]